MSRWFRHYAGMARDEKLVRVAIKSGQPLERVVWVWIAILESAAERNDDGKFEFDAEECAYFLRCEPEAISSIHQALEGQGRIGEGRISKWDARQYKTDSSTDRVRRHREKRASAGLTAQWQPSKEFRQFIYDRDGNSCVYCGSGDDLTIDHKTPELRGGDNSEDNLQTACRQCNAAKRDLTHEEFVARNACNVSETGQRKKTETEVLEPDGSRASRDAPEGANDDEADEKLRPEHIVAKWNELAPSMGKPTVRDLTPERRQLLKARIGQYSVDDFVTVFGNIRGSPFLRGDTGKQFCTFDWAMKKANFQKILEGNYAHG